VLQPLEINLILHFWHPNDLVHTFAISKFVYIETKIHLKLIWAAKTYIITMSDGLKVSYYLSLNLPHQKSACSRWPLFGVKIGCNKSSSWVFYLLLEHFLGLGFKNLWLSTYLNKTGICWRIFENLCLFLQFVCIPILLWVMLFEETPFASFELHQIQLKFYLFCPNLELLNNRLFPFYTF